MFYNGSDKKTNIDKKKSIIN